MQALHIFWAEIWNLCGESAVYLKKCGPRMNMQTLADYALNYAIAYSHFSGGTDICEPPHPPYHPS
jgi:hypothetical protein